MAESLPAAAPLEHRKVLVVFSGLLITMLLAARREHLAELVADWHPERHEELARLLRQLGRELVPDAPRSAL